MGLTPSSVARVMLSLLFSSGTGFCSLTFDGLQNGEQVLNYYNGGFGGNGSGPGPSDGVSFSSGLAASPISIAFGPSAVLTAPSVTMNLSSPFQGFVSFYYEGSGSISFFSGMNGAGSLLASEALANGPGGFPFGLSVGPFQSAVFAVSGNSSLAVDSITMGGLVIPEPAPASLVFGGIALLTFLAFARSSRTAKRNTPQMS